MGEPDVAVALVEVIQNPAHEPGTKYWACKGLQEFLAPENRMPPVTIKDQALLGRIAVALIELIDQKWPVSQATPPAEIDGVRVLRREAIHALWLTQKPAFAGDKDKLSARTAQVLLRVVRKDGFVPEPRWDEEVEAAIGIGWLQSAAYPGYQPDYAAYNAAYAVLDLAQKYLDEKQREGDRGWRYVSARLEEAFENLSRDVTKAHARDKKLVTYVNDVVKQSLGVLHLIGTKGDVRAGEFEQWLQEHPATSQTVYKGLDDSKVTPAQPPAEK
jgi:hypothetical protein